MYLYYGIYYSGYPTIPRVLDTFPSSLVLWTAPTKGIPTGSFGNLQPQLTTTAIGGEISTMAGIMVTILFFFCLNLQCPTLSPGSD